MEQKNKQADTKSFKNKKNEKNIVLTLIKVISTLVILAFQIIFMILIYTGTKGVSVYLTTIFEVIKIIAVISLLYRKSTPEYKISWIIFIMFLPVVGIVAFFLWGNSRIKSYMARRFSKIHLNTKKYLRSSIDIENDIAIIDKSKLNQFKYIGNTTGYPVYKNNGVKYFSKGIDFFETLKQDLKNAKKYIFIEFYIIASGTLYNEIFSILKEKANAGVKIYIIYDAIGSMNKIPKNFEEDMMSFGIKTYKFNPFNIIISGYANYRDHRKIVVIDGKVAYTGGVNISDEYVNYIEKYGYWKDVGIKIQGEPVNSFIVMFVGFLEQLSNKKIDIKEFLNLEELVQDEDKGYVSIFDDGPDNMKSPTENIYIQTITYSKNYIYITTPYLIIGESILDSIVNSARSGVDVKIILPYIPDKKIINIATKSYYEVLLEAGVKVYEYTPGFIHSKTFVSDDEIAIVGTANLDFRSMYLNFECSSLTYRTGEELAIKRDFEEMLLECKEVKLENWRKRNIFTKIIEAVLTAFSPML